MALKLPHIARNSAIYVVFNVLQRAINFFLLPLYTIYLTPEDYGITNVLISVSALLTFLFTLSLQSASARFHYKYIRDKQLCKKIWGSNYLFIIFSSFFWVLIVCLSYKYTLRYLIGDDIPFYPYALIGILNCAFSPIYLYFQTYLQTTQQAKFFVINNLAFFLCQLFLTIFMVVFLQWKALGVILSQLIVNTIFGIYAIIALRKHIIYSFSAKILKKSLRYSVPLIPHNLSGWLNGMLDRIFINKIINLASVGLYSIAFQFGSLINLITMGVNQAFTPFFFSNHTTEAGRNKILKVTDFGILCITVIGLIISLFSQEILVIMTDSKYHTIWPSIIILVAANLYDCIYKFHVAVLFLEKTKELSFISISCAILTCVLNYILISNIGYIGAAISFLIVQFMTSVVVTVYAKKLRPDIKYNTLLHFFEISMAMIISIIVIVISQDLPIIAKILLKSLSFFAIVFMIILLNRKSLSNLKQRKYE